MKLFFAKDSSTDCMGIYGPDKKLIYGWQEGDDISRVIQNLANFLGHDMEKIKMPEVDGEIPKVLK